MPDRQALGGLCRRIVDDGVQLSARNSPRCTSCLTPPRVICRCDGSAQVTVRAKVWVASPKLLADMMVTLYTPLLPVEGVPAMVAVPLPLPVRVSPDGSPVAVMAAYG